MISHLICTIKNSNQIETSTQLIPSIGQCNSCKQIYPWVDVVRSIIPLNGNKNDLRGDEKEGENEEDEEEEGEIDVIEELNSSEDDDDDEIFQNDVEQILSSSH